MNGPHVDEERVRHAARRRAGVPTVSVQVGCPEGRVAGNEVEADGAHGWLGRVAPRLAGNAGAGAGLAAEFPDLGRVPLPAGAEGWTLRLRAVFDAAEARDPGDGWRVLAAVAEAVGAGDCPAFTRSAGSVGELVVALRFATRLAERCPALAVVVRVPEAAVWAGFERIAPESREKAVAREGLIVHHRPTPARFAPARGFLDRLPVGPAVRAEFAATVAAMEAAAGDGEMDRARSAAERFLFDLLEALPDTRGLFQLNAPLPFRFGLKVAEADLLAADLRLVVEVDGYRHFTGAEGYRRDRRKDFLLQSQGYFVLRVLADDVVTRLEEILADIREAAALQRVRRPGAGVVGGDVTDREI